MMRVVFGVLMIRIESSWLDLKLLKVKSKFSQLNLLKAPNKIKGKVYMLILLRLKNRKTKIFNRHTKIRISMRVIYTTRHSFKSSHRVNRLSFKMNKNTISNNRKITVKFTNRTSTLTKIKLINKVIPNR